MKKKPIDGFDFMGYVQTVCCYLVQIAETWKHVESRSVLFSTGFGVLIRLLNLKSILASLIVVQTLFDHERWKWWPWMS